MTCLNLKVVLIGDTGVGKSSLAYAMSSDDGRCTKTIGPTVGAGYIRANIRSPLGGMIGFDIWDTAGQERYRSLVPMYLRGANVILYVVDGSRSSVESLRNHWVPYVRNITGGSGLSPMGLIIRNKCDEVRDGSTDVDNDLDEFSLLMGWDIIRTSATQGINTLQILRTIVRKYQGELTGEWDTAESSTPPMRVLKLPPSPRPDTPEANHCRC